MIEVVDINLNRKGHNMVREASKQTRKLAGEYRCGICRNLQSAKAPLFWLYEDSFRSVAICKNCNHGEINPGDRLTFALKCIGWQGGTVHQVNAEINRITRNKCDINKESYDSFLVNMYHYVSIHEYERSN